MLRKNRLHEVKLEIVNFLNSKIQDSGLNGFVVGISGGIDSAVTSKLCAETGKEVILCDLPIQQSQHEETKSESFGEKLSYEYSNVTYIKDSGLNTVYSSFPGRTPINTNKYQKEDTELAEANLKSRLRMCYLYYIANKKGMLVTGTGNLVEDFGIGFFTKYGDGAVDIAPIADLYKSEVYQLGEYLDVDEEILKAKPTDGLWNDTRSDEDQIGLTYDEIEKIMKGNTSDLSQSKIDKYLYLRNSNEHKIQNIPTFIIKEEFRMAK